MVLPQPVLNLDGIFNHDYILEADLLVHYALLAEGVEALEEGLKGVGDFFLGELYSTVASDSGL